MKTHCWDTHVHTSESSLCGRATAMEMVHAYKAKGYDGIFITDHFVNGNSVVADTAPWHKKIRALLNGYWQAAAVGDSIGLFVFLGWEYYWEGGDYLTFGLSEEFLFDQPDLCDITIEEYCKRVHAAGGIVSQAHPFRTAWYMPDFVARRSDLVDAFEVLNGSHGIAHRDWDDQALALAISTHRLMTAGSDAHAVETVGTSGLCIRSMISSPDDFILALQKGETEIIRR